MIDSGRREMERMAQHGHLAHTKKLNRLVLGLGVCLLPTFALGQNTGQQQVPPPPLSPKKLELGQKQSELDELSLQAKLSSERIAELDSEIAKLKNDELSITAAVIQSAKTQKKLSADIDEIEGRLTSQRDEEKQVLVSLKSRRGILAEVLGALERMGLNPPPAILVKPDDALSSVRSAILLGAVVPQLRGETDKLLADLDALKRITNSITTERENLLATLRQQGEEKHRLDALIVEKQRLRNETEQARIAENQRVAALANQAGSLKELIATLRQDLEAEDQASERLRRDEEKRIALEREKARNSQDTALLAPGGNLKKLKGTLALPVSGKQVMAFGANDGFGGKTAGMTFEASAGSIVTTPVDATVLYAGPFRSYHQLLILDAGSGYHLVMGGMDRSMVTTGQFLLAGEPVGIMGQGIGSSAATLTKLPELYIELREEGQPVDSAPWWAGEPKGRTGNAT